MEEICGIAEGSGFLTEEILALNVRSEIVMQGNQVNMTLDGGCTSCAIMPYKTQSGETWLAQNWDWKEAAHGTLILLEIKQQNKPQIIMITEAGIVGKIGFNSAGIGVGLNALGSDKGWKGETLPLHIALRGALNSYKLSDAIGRAGCLPLACCANFLMGASEGQVVSVELGPGEIDVIYPEHDKGYITHANHFYGPRTTHIRDTGRIGLPDSYLRLGRINDLLAECGNRKINLDDIKRILKDHMGYPDSICRHNDCLDQEGMRLQTNFSVIMNLSQKEMLYACGSPCSHKFFSYKMDV